jgi:hypothetical protein
VLRGVGSGLEDVPFDATGRLARVSCGERDWGKAGRENVIRDNLAFK